MHLVVDHPRDQVFSDGVDHVGAVGRGDAAADLLDTIADNEHVGVLDASLVDKARVAD